MRMNYKHILVHFKLMLNKDCRVNGYTRRLTIRMGKSNKRFRIKFSIAK